jgi:hypothetical protein
LEVTGFAAVDAVVESVLTQAHVVLTLTKAAIPITLAAVLFFIAIETDKFFSHELCRTSRL